MLLFLKGGNSKLAWKAATQTSLLETADATFNRLQVTTTVF